MDTLCKSTSEIDGNKSSDDNGDDDDGDKTDMVEYKIQWCCPNISLVDFGSQSCLICAC